MPKTAYTETGPTGAAELFSRLEDSLGHLVRRSLQLHTALWAETVEGGLTSGQYAILSALYAYPGMRPASIREIASLDRSTAADVVARLERNSWIVRNRDTQDARRSVLALTPPARVAIPRITLQARGVQDRLLEPLDATGAARLIELLGRVAHADDTDATPTPDPAAPVLDLSTSPTHLLRRIEQRQQRIWSEIVGKIATPTQYAVFCALREETLDQKSIGALASLDTSNTADVISRLRNQSLLVVARDEQDGRRRLVGLSPRAIELLRDLTPRALAVHQALSSPLTADETAELLRMLRIVSKIESRDAQS